MQRSLGLLVLGACVFALGAPATRSNPKPHDEFVASTLSMPDQGPHRDHNPKHGGTFFMSTDYKHHLEGTFVSPGIFRIYLYDARTQPLNESEMKRVHGSIQIGESETAPKVPLVAGSRKETLEANLGNRVRFPVAITLQLYLPGMESSAKPELFNFRFTRFTVTREAGN